jgi:ribosome maturation factor RimP
LDEQKFTGILKTVDDEKISIASQVSKKETLDVDIEFKNIKESNVIISFK